MATGAAGDKIVRAVFGGCISGEDTTVKRRPYHRNCSCALHKSYNTHCPHVGNNKVSYPIRRSWSEGCLVAMMASASASASASPGSSPYTTPSTPPAASPAAVRDPPPVKLPPHLPK